MRFYNSKHYSNFKFIRLKMHSRDIYHSVVAYLLALDENIVQNKGRVSDCYDFSENTINVSALEKSWVTGTDRRVLTLAFHLWNESNVADISNVFSCWHEYQEYFFEAIRMRFDPNYDFKKSQIDRDDNPMELAEDELEELTDKLLEN